MRRGREPAWLAAALLAAACGGGNTGGPADGGAPPPVDAAPDAPAAAGHDAYPTGAIGFYLAVTCPPGWDRYAEAAGRTIVPVSGAPDIGVGVGAPLAANEHRLHRHGAEVSLELPSTSFAGIAGGGNSGVAGAGIVTGTVSTDDAEADLPYLQLLVCRKTEPPADGTLPAGLVTFFADPSCPAGWTAATGAEGRLLVGLPRGGTAGASFGGAPLAPGERRGHSHPITATLPTTSHGIALASGCCAGGYAANGSHPIAATTAPEPVDFPYLQLLACAKD